MGTEDSGNLIRVAIVDDHPAILRGVAAALEAEKDIEVIHAIKTGEEALELLGDDRIDVMLLDLNLPEVGGVDVLNQKENERPRIVILSVNSPEVYAPRCRKAGAAGFIPKTAEDDVIISAVRRVHAGEEFFPTQDGRTLNHSEIALARLTDRELEILKRLITGVKNRSIASELSISEKTVSAHRVNIMAKLEVANMVDLLIICQEGGLVAR